MDNQKHFPAKDVDGNPALVVATKTNGSVSLAISEKLGGDIEVVLKDVELRDLIAFLAKD